MTSFIVPFHYLIARNSSNLLHGAGLKTGASKRKETPGNKRETPKSGFKHKKTIGLTISASKLLCHQKSVFNGTLLVEEITRQK